MLKNWNRRLSACIATSATLSLTFMLGCDSSSSSSSGSSSNAAAQAGDGFMVVINQTSRDFAITLTGAPVLQTNVTMTAASTNVTATGTTASNTTVIAVSPEPITRDARPRLTTVIPLAPNTYRARFKVKTSQREGEVSVIVSEGSRTQVSVLLDPNNVTALKLSVSN